MQLDLGVFHFVSEDQWKCLETIELGMNRMEYVALSYISGHTKFKSNDLESILGSLIQYKLIQYERTKGFKGYRLSSKGYDYITLNYFFRNNFPIQVGQRIGVGKEADVHIAKLDDHVVALKIHRLGRTSFRNVRNTRGYLKPGESKKNWMLLSSKSAETEAANLIELNNLISSVPKYLFHNRHMILMEYVDGFLLNKAKDLSFEEVETLYKKLYDTLVTLAENNYVHGDYNEFNIILSSQSSANNIVIFVIDFPQTIKFSDIMSRELFERDVENIRKFFVKRFQYLNDYVPSWNDITIKNDGCNNNSSSLINVNQTY